MIAPRPPKIAPRWAQDSLKRLREGKLAPQAVKEKRARKREKKGERERKNESERVPEGTENCPGRRVNRHGILAHPLRAVLLA